jgi:hypothetical protein
MTMDGLWLLSTIVAALVLFGATAAAYGVDTRDDLAESRIRTDLR